MFLSCSDGGKSDLWCHCNVIASCSKLTMLIRHFISIWITGLKAVSFYLQKSLVIRWLYHTFPGSSLYVTGIRSWRNWNFQDLSWILESFSCWALQGKSVFNICFSVAFGKSTLWCSSKETALFASIVQGNPCLSKGTVKIQIPFLNLEILLHVGGDIRKLFLLWVVGNWFNSI